MFYSCSFNIKNPPEQRFALYLRNAYESLSIPHKQLCSRSSNRTREEALKGMWQIPPGSKFLELPNLYEEVNSFADLF